MEAKVRCDQELAIHAFYLAMVEEDASAI